jgi:hypothetical protein
VVDDSTYEVCNVTWRRRPRLILLRVVTLQLWSRRSWGSISHSMTRDRLQSFICWVLPQIFCLNIIQPSLLYAIGKFGSTGMGLYSGMKLHLWLKSLLHAFRKQSCGSSGFQRRIDLYQIYGVICSIQQCNIHIELNKQCNFIFWWHERSRSMKSHVGETVPLLPNLVAHSLAGLGAKLRPGASLIKDSIPACINVLVTNDLASSSE